MRFRLTPSCSNGGRIHELRIAAKRGISLFADSASEGELDTNRLGRGPETWKLLGCARKREAYQNSSVKGRITSPFH